ncbi:hypothetical protein BDZ91DRAFT_772929 [Kalaharituber pfeilii]|nr:hypothetical protein BDZ91DRAFT_772929 [Kalaharituber pfeilii]
MSPRYERVNTEDVDDARDIHGNRIDDDPVSPTVAHSVSLQRQNSYPQPIPNSPPPSFQSVIQADRTLQDSFDLDSDDEGHDMRDLRRSPNSSNSFHESIPLVPTSTSSSSRLGASSSVQASAPARAVTPSGRRIGNGNDGVFANISAKPSVEEEEQLPSYEQAAADPPPPFWETTIMAPGMAGDEVFIDGLPVGTFFAFIWNAMISMSFQLVGFLLTYLLHSSHAAKNGSRAGLGVTLIQYGFYMRSQPDDTVTGGTPPPEAEPSDPNNYQFDAAGDTATEVAANTDTITQNEWLSYIFMIVGWFVLIRAITDFLRARRTEAVILASPDRGLGVAVIADNETPERAV